MSDHRTMWEMCAYALVVPCETCGAPIDERCRTAGGREAGHPHAARRDTARRLQVRAAR